MKIMTTRTRMIKYRGLFNWHGEIHTLYTSAKCQQSAFSNFMAQLSKRLKIARGIVVCYYVDGRKDNWEIKRR